MAKQAKHVFYVQHSCDENWLVVLHGKTIGVNLEDDDSIPDTCHTHFSTHMPTINGKYEVDDVHAKCNNNDEGELINIT